MNGYANRRIAATRFERIGGLLAALVYAIVSLNLHDFSRPAPHAAGPVIHSGAGSEFNSVVSREAISLSGAAAESGRESPVAHRCCCKHEGGDCAMGCCKAGMAAANPGEACFRACPGAGQSEGQVVPRFPAHLATEGNLPAPAPDRIPLLSLGGRNPSAIPRKPPEKVPIPRSVFHT